MKKGKNARILITGATGLLGKKMMAVLPQLGFEVLGTASRAAGKIKKMDITDSREVMEVISGYRPDAVIHAAAITKVDWCEDNKDETFKVNVEGTRNVADACMKAGAKMVFISTDYVFDGTKESKYTEGDRRNPIGVYAQSKAAAEEVVEQMLDDYIIARVTVIYGYNDGNDKETFVTYVKKTLEKGIAMHGFTDQFNNPTFIDDIALATARLIEMDELGVFNMTGSENLNRYEFAGKIAKVFGLDASLIKKGSWDESGHKAPRAKRLNDSIAKLEKRGIRMRNIEEGLGEMKRQMDKAKK